VINISEAVCVPPEQGASAGAPVHAALKYAADADVVVVAAAGNLGTGSCANPQGLVSLPGWFDELITVGAVGDDGRPAPFTVPGPWVDVAAPGMGLRSLAVGGGTTGAGIEGTSFATPWVSGLAALLRERYPKLTARQITDRIVATARRPADGRDDTVGYGVIDPLAALTAVPTVLMPEPPAARTRPSVELASNAPPASDHGLPLDLLAAGVLIVAGGVAAWWLRRRPA
jgi:membrane-anchored mycosin MYCP